MIYFTADCHFFHHNIIKYCNRPFSSAEEMNEKLITNWNSIVRPNDSIYILGDFAFQGHTKILPKLNGTKFFVFGNHDKRREVRQAVDEGLLVWAKEIYELKWENKFFELFHYPMRSWNRKFHGSIHLYGHTHAILPPYDLSFDVGVDAWDYYPVSITQIVKVADKLKEQLKEQDSPPSPAWEGKRFLND